MDREAQIVLTRLITQMALTKTDIANATRRDYIAAIVRNAEYLAKGDYGRDGS